MSVEKNERTEERWPTCCMCKADSAVFSCGSYCDTCVPSALRATIERLEKERDEMQACLDIPTLAQFQPCGCQVCVCEDVIQCQGCGSKNCGTHPNAPMPNPIYKKHPLLERAESAEATIARLAKVVRAAEEYRDRGRKHSGRFESFVAVRDAYDAALSSLTPEDRRRAGIEP